MVSDGNEFAVGDIDRLFEEARRNTKAKHEKMEKYYNRQCGGMCKLKPRGGREVESQPAMEMKTQQGGPVRSRKSRGRNDNPYIEERTRSGNRNVRRIGDQQREYQERKGASTRRSLSLGRKR
ncbi:uncharacterized protein TNCV_2412801 [Trichonephila clavipes]|nr:uncharacterized protein TNCV_2412801 [Trichonephila clavipes]